MDDRISYIIRYIKETIRCYEWVQVAKEQLQPLLDDEDNDSRVDNSFGVPIHKRQRRN